MGRSATVRADKARRHMLDLIDQGANTVSISEASGVSTSIVRAIVRDAKEMITRETQNRILSVRDVPIPTMRLSIGARRRLRALSVKGWDLDTIAEEVGAFASLLSSIRYGERTHVLKRVDEQVREFYDKHKDQQGPSKISATRAKIKGWHGPEAWEGVDIDNPRSEPRV